MEEEDPARGFEIANTLIHFLPLISLIALGTHFAHRWLIQPPPAIQQFPRSLRIGVLILGCWFGTFAATRFSLNLGTWWFNDDAYDEGIEVSYSVMYDGVGSDIYNLLLGWLVGFLCWGLATSLSKWRQNESMTAEESR